MSAEILRIVNEDRRAAGKLVRGIGTALEKSFRADRIKVPPTRAEVVRRTKICLDVARMLKGDLKWSVDRIVGALPDALRAKLDGLPWEPPKQRTLFAASPDDPLERMIRSLENEKRRKGIIL